MKIIYRGSRKQKKEKNSEILIRVLPISSKTLPLQPPPIFNVVRGK